MTSPADAALRKIEQALSRDPILREVVSRTLPRAAKGGRFAPEIDVVELADRFVILLDLPGVARESLSVELDGMHLVVAGHKPARHPEGGRVKVAERGTGEFRREFLLPCLVDGDRVRAKLQDGVLRVEVPRAGSSKRVDVEVG